MSVDIGPTETAILSRIIRPDHSGWSKDAAESILRFDFAPDDVQRMNVLAAKVQQSSLTGDEEVELENYRRVGRLLELLQSKARISLKRLASTA